MRSHKHLDLIHLKTSKGQHKYLMWAWRMRLWLRLVLYLRLRYGLVRLVSVEPRCAQWNVMLGTAPL